MGKTLDEMEEMTQEEVGLWLAHFDEKGSVEKQILLLRSFLFSVYIREEDQRRAYPIFFPDITE